MDELMRKAFEALDDNDPVLIWSNQHQAWWADRAIGYVPSPAFAGRYSRGEARHKVADAYIGWNEQNPCPEVLVPTGPQLTDHTLADLAAEMTQAATIAWDARQKRAELEYAMLYNERSHFIAYLASIHPSVMTPAPDAPGYMLVFVTLPEGHGQLSWHIHPNDFYLFDHVHRVAEWQWDGHSTKEKYNRLQAATKTARTWVAGPIGE